MNFEYLFILTYGRSGSTLLQGILNSIPGVLIRGENNGALRGLFRSWRSIRVAKGLPLEAEMPQHPWYGIQDVDEEVFGRDLAAVFVKNVLRPTPDTVLTGFKEIRYFKPLAPHLDQEVEFMRHFFSRAAFIINTRELEATIRSATRARQKVTPQQLRASDVRLREMASEGNDDTYHVHYDDYLSDVGRLRGLFDFLGATFDQERISEVMNRTHSTRTRPEGGPLSSDMAEQHLHETALVAELSPDRDAS